MSNWIILVPPVISMLNPGRNITVRKGSTVKLVCNATGFPKPEIVWERQVCFLIEKQCKWKSIISRKTCIFMKYWGYQDNQKMINLMTLIIKICKNGIRMAYFRTSSILNVKAIRLIAKYRTKFFSFHFCSSLKDILGIFLVLLIH